MANSFKRLWGLNMPRSQAVSDPIAWRALAVKAKESQLTEMRDLATKWASSLTLLTTVLAIGGLTISPEALSMTLPVWHNLGIWILALIIVFFAAASFFAIWASQGHPIQTTDDPNEYAAFYNRVVSATVARLAVSRWLSFISLLLILIFGWIVLFTPIDISFNKWNAKPLTEEEAETPRFSVVRTADGPVYCGVLSYQKDGQAVLTPISETAEPIVLTKVTDIQETSKCE
ncbi:hypothetical protein ACFP9V_22660 [Deinococcus radiopugnans]|uniref:Uncharacterized protein n=1 Tax=Deinococcus radiopugnans ATCC 19172 TaxID=585398 RepID=A0A5C4Y4B4_9DEIO|nr:hypothetical protein [Deinococcus radiopugnans]MBB6017064.1 hypothetical protein [Deinococcus radiopugnans ATCC 19172]TNM70702.1 hypothetical protein FHR04_12440 [Deinococcus radiopugnans ATCC 19172]